VGLVNLIVPMCSRRGRISVRFRSQSTAARTHLRVDTPASLQRLTAPMISDESRFGINGPEAGSGVSDGIASSAVNSAFRVVGRVAPPGPPMRGGEMVKCQGRVGTPLHQKYSVCIFPFLAEGESQRASTFHHVTALPGSLVLSGCIAADQPIGKECFDRMAASRSNQFRPDHRPGKAGA
jgi:hypothetical protein